MAGHRLRPLGPPWLRWSLGLLILAAALIFGLLAMHTLSPASAPVSSAMTSHFDQAMGTHADGSAAPDSGGHPGSNESDTCDGCSVPGHSMMLMACVIALFAGILLVFAPGRRVLAWLIPRKTWIAGRWDAAGAALPRPPSLIALSISRT